MALLLFVLCLFGVLDYCNAAAILGQLDVKDGVTSKSIKKADILPRFFLGPEEITQSRIIETTTTMTTLPPENATLSRKSYDFRRNNVRRSQIGETSYPPSEEELINEAIQDFLDEFYQ